MKTIIDLEKLKKYCKDMRIDIAQGYDESQWENQADKPEPEIYLNGLADGIRIALSWIENHKEEL